MSVQPKADQPLTGLRLPWLKYFWSSTKSSMIGDDPKTVAAMTTFPVDAALRGAQEDQADWQRAHVGGVSHDERPVVVPAPGEGQQREAHERGLRYGYEHVPDDPAVTAVVRAASAGPAARSESSGGSETRRKRAHQERCDQGGVLVDQPNTLKIRKVKHHQHLRRHHHRRQEGDEDQIPASGTPRRSKDVTRRRTEDQGWLTMIVPMSAMMLLIIPVERRGVPHRRSSPRPSVAEDQRGRCAYTSCQA